MVLRFWPAVLSSAVEGIEGDSTPFGSSPVVSGYGGEWAEGISIESSLAMGPWLSSAKGILFLSKSIPIGSSPKSPTHWWIHYIFAVHLNMIPPFDSLLHTATLFALCPLSVYYPTKILLPWMLCKRQMNLSVLFSWHSWLSALGGLLGKMSGLQLILLSEPGFPSWFLW